MHRTTSTWFLLAIAWSLPCLSSAQTDIDAAVLSEATDTSEVTMPPEDPCFDLLLSRSPLAERACSDVAAALESLVSPDPADVQALVSAYNNRSVARMRSGDLEGAGEDLARAMTLAPDSWLLHLNRGNLMLERREPENALADYEAARRLSTQPLPEALLNAALAHRLMGDLLGAERLLRAWTEATSAY